MKLLKNPFNTYRVTYRIVSSDTTQFKGLCSDEENQQSKDQFSSK